MTDEAACALRARILPRVGALAVASLAPGVARAHTPGLSDARLTDPALVLRFSERDLAERVPMADLDASRILLQELIVDPIVVTAGDARCVLGTPGYTRVEGDGLEARVPLHCPGDVPGAAWAYTAGFLPALGASHRHTLSMDAAGAEHGTPAMTMLTAASPTARWEGSVGSPVQVLGAFGRLGVEHIFTGYDHLCFLAGLLLGASRLREMLAIVTGFTLAHSLTLALAALDVVRPPAAMVEVAIAASIVFVGVENVRLGAPSAAQARPLRGRVALTFGLGLVHGFGVAGLLTDLGLPRAHVVTALVGFNLGVEAGQAALVALALPALLVLHRQASWPQLHRVASILVALLGAGWLVERLAGV